MKNATNRIAVIAIAVGIALYNIVSLFTSDQRVMFLFGIGGFFYFIYLFYDAKTPEAIDMAFAKIGKHISFVIVLVSYFMLIDWIVGLLNVQPEHKALAYLGVYLVATMVVTIIVLKMVTKKK